MICRGDGSGNEVEACTDGDAHFWFCHLLAVCLRQVT